MTEYVIVGPDGWGRGWNEYDALAEMVSHLDFPRDERIPVSMFEVPEDADWSIGMYSFKCDEEFIQEDEYDLDPELAQRIAVLSDDLELAVENLLLDAMDHKEEDES